MNSHLVQALQQEFQLCAKDIADIFWLASHIYECSESVTPPEEANASLLAQSSADSSSSSQPSTEPTPQTPSLEDSATTPQENLPENQPHSPISPATPQPPQGEILPKPEPSQTAAGGGGLPIRVPDAPSLREPLTLARALKPLMRRVSGGRDGVIDEAATSEQIASHWIPVLKPRLEPWLDLDIDEAATSKQIASHWIPVLKPRLEPWLDLDLVIEDCVSMLLWRHTLRDLEKLLKNYGIFRDVRVWSLLSDNPEAVKIRRGIGATAKHQAPRSPKELIDPTGRRLVIVVSDCVSKVWREGKMTPILDLWAKRGSMAILQMLPEWMWKRSGLGWEALVRLQGLNPGDCNQNLKVDEFPLWWDKEVTHQVVKVPIFTLEPESVGSWARLVAGKGKVWAPGYLFKYAENQRPRRRPNSGGELTAEKRVNGFRAMASRVGRKLAGLLAAAPVITLPVVRLIQETLLKESLPVHVAEVFLGGLLNPISAIDIDTDPDLVQYDFMPGVRELLLESVPVDETVSVIDEVSEYIADKFKFDSAKDFVDAILKNPQQLGDGPVQENAISFARVTAQILRSLGGAYIEFAEELESPAVVEEPPAPIEEPEPEENQQIVLRRFWQQLLQAEMQGDTAAVHQVMRENRGLIVPELGDIIAQSIPELLAQNPDQGEGIARLVENTCISIQQFPYGRYAETLEIAIRGYDVLFALKPDNPAKARTLTNLGNAYQTQAELGMNPAANLERAIAAYDEAAHIQRQLGLDLDLSRTLTNLGLARLAQAQMGINPTANLESALVAHDEAAHIQRQLGLDLDLSRTLTNLGLARLTQAQMGINPTANLESALVAHDEAAHIQGQLGLDLDLSRTLTNLGLAYRTQAELGMNPAANLERAIAAYDAAAEILRRLGLEKDLSRTLTKLGLARLSQAEMGINPSANLERAIAAYDQAAEILRRLQLEKDLSSTLTNLGNARRTQAEMGINPSANLDSAIAAYDEAAHILRQLGLEKDLSTTLTNLGNARRTQAEMGINPSANLDSAIAAYDEAAHILRRLQLEKDLSSTLTNLGNACRTQAEIGINPSANLDSAIAAYDEAVEIRRRLGLEKDLSTTLTNLGVAHLTQAQMGIKPAANLESAIAAYDEAAHILRRLGLARDLAETLNNFGVAYQTQSRLAGNSPTQKQQALENAYRSFQEAVDLVEYLRGEIGADSEGYKRHFNEEWNKVYLRMVEVCLDLGRYQDALEYVDHSKARNLAELMANRDAYPGGVIPGNIRERLQSLKLAIYQEERRLQDDKNPDYTYLNQLRQEKQELEPYKPLRFQDIQALLDEETAILEWYIVGSSGFEVKTNVISFQGFQQSGELQNVSNHPIFLARNPEEPFLPDKFLTFTITPHSLNLWTSSQEDGQNLIDWTTVYYQDYYNDKSQWQENLPQRLETLSQILHLDEILSNLRQNFPNCQKLILIPHRHLHLFPLHALPVSVSIEGASIAPLQDDTVGAQRLRPIPLQDLFPKGVAYVPNCQLLQQLQNRPRPDFNRLFAINDPTGDLNWSEIEVEAISNIFPQRETFGGKNARLATFLNKNLSQTHHLYFSGRAGFNPTSPLDSGLLLADGVLTLENIIANLNLSNCRLVTLSASETGQVAIDQTDEYISLASGFLLAGSANVVCSLWSPLEVPTAILMIRFYETLHQQPNSSVALALQQSQQWLREATVAYLLVWADNCPLISEGWRQLMKDALTSFFGKNGLDVKPFESPYHWAGFVAIGA
ncbi:SAV_2336 N-terminal domain-related protein [Laspinema olomoucense]|uniref:SAV_2336 N-terminal domain-related protein n=1 Tax=Laspinema olomoucense TaxID=3231600 RepID=UPI0021BB481D|nr:SAV_2336 N-terminal domain-related protein [Laspinema sp. D3d]MCT7973432.1 CHAT domain-containing protein [Laspinema sp. D3d]